MLTYPLSSRSASLRQRLVDVGDRFPHSSDHKTSLNEFSFKIGDALLRFLDKLVERAPEYLDVLFIFAGAVHARNSIAAWRRQCEGYLRATLSRCPRREQ